MDDSSNINKAKHFANALIGIINNSLTFFGKFWFNFETINIFEIHDGKTKKYKGIIVIFAVIPGILYILGSILVKAVINIKDAALNAFKVIIRDNKKTSEKESKIDIKKDNKNYN